MDTLYAKNPETREEVSNHPLECCTRIVPHDHNIRAFFITFLFSMAHILVRMNAMDDC